MVRFGQYILANQIAGWEDYYIGYKALKKRIRLYGNRASIATNEERQEIMKSFSELLDSQVKLSHLFFTSFSLDLRVDTNWSKMTDYTFFVSV
jgi:SPX domain protein involved in polyphosphate accumulation